MKFRETGEEYIQEAAGIGAMTIVTVVFAVFVFWRAVTRIRLTRSGASHSQHQGASIYYRQNLQVAFVSLESIVVVIALMLFVVDMAFLSTPLSDYERGVVARLIPPVVLLSTLYRFDAIRLRTTGPCTSYIKRPWPVKTIGWLLYSCGLVVNVTEIIGAVSGVYSVNAYFLIVVSIILLSLAASFWVRPLALGVCETFRSEQGVQVFLLIPLSAMATLLLVAMIPFEFMLALRSEAGAERAAQSTEPLKTILVTNGDRFYVILVILFCLYVMSSSLYYRYFETGALSPVRTMAVEVNYLIADRGKSDALPFPLAADSWEDDPASKPTSATVSVNASATATATAAAPSPAARIELMDTTAAVTGVAGKVA